MLQLGFKQQYESGQYPLMAESFIMLGAENFGLPLSDIQVEGNCSLSLRMFGGEGDKGDLSYSTAMQMLKLRSVQNGPSRFLRFLTDITRNGSRKHLYVALDIAGQCGTYEGPGAPIVVINSGTHLVSVCLWEEKPTSSDARDSLKANRWATQQALQFVQGPVAPCWSLTGISGEVGLDILPNNSGITQIALTVPEHVMKCNLLRDTVIVPACIRTIGDTDWFLNQYYLFSSPRV